MNIEKLKELMQEKKMSMLELSKESTIGYATLHDILSGKSKNPRVNTIKKIANALNVKIESLIQLEEDIKIEKKSSFNYKEKQKETNY